MPNYINIGPSEYNIYNDNKVIHVINNVISEKYTASNLYKIEIVTFDNQDILRDKLSLLQGKDFYIQRVSYRKIIESEDIVRVYELYKCNTFMYVCNINSTQNNYVLTFYDCEKVLQ